MNERDPAEKTSSANGPKLSSKSSMKSCLCRLVQTTPKKVNVEKLVVFGLPREQYILQKKKKKQFLTGKIQSEIFCKKGPTSFSILWNSKGHCED